MPDPDRAEVMFSTYANYYSIRRRSLKARLYLASKNPSGNAIRAARMLKRANNAGHVGAKALLGQMLFEGNHVSKDRVLGLAI